MLRHRQTLNEGELEVDHSNDEDGTYLTKDGMLVMLNEGGHNGTRIDVRELVAWLRENRPDLLEEYVVDLTEC